MTNPPADTFDVAEGRIEALQSALSLCAEKFRFYEASHRAKATPDADAKAAVNDEMASMCEELLRDTAPPMRRFTTAPGMGIAMPLPDDRQVALHFGSDELGNELFAARFVNQGRTTTILLSDEALDALIKLYVNLSVQAMERVAAPEVPTA